jgi:hypothetical protein
MNIGLHTLLLILIAGFCLVGILATTKLRGFLKLLRKAAPEVANELRTPAHVANYLLNGEHKHLRDPAARAAANSIQAMLVFGVLLFFATTAVAFFRN